MTDARTAAGRALLETISQKERLAFHGLRMDEYRAAILAIEDEAADEATRQITLDDIARYRNRQAAEPGR